MKQTVIVFREENIMAASGRSGRRPQLEQVKNVDLPGFGDPFGRWMEGLKILKEQMELHNVRIVLPSTMCSVKFMQLPYVKGKELAELSQRELQENFRSGLMDYAVVQSNAQNGTSLACASVEESVVKRFLEMFKQLDISVNGMTAPIEGIWRVLSRVSTRNQTAVFLFFQEGGVTSVLMEKGQYKYSGGSRLFAEPGTLDFGTEIVRTVSGIMQFQTASKSEERITNLYYAGCAPDDFEVCVGELSEMNLEVGEIDSVSEVSMPAGKRVSDWVACAGAMMNGVRGMRDIDFLQMYQKSEKAETGEKPLLWHALPVVATFLVCAVVFAGVKLSASSLARQVDKTQQWIESTRESETYAAAVAAEREARRVEDAIQLVKRTTERLATYPQVDSDVINRIEAVGNDSISFRLIGYDSATGNLTFESFSRDVIDIPAYIASLQQTGLFHSVDYTGYVYENGEYTLSLLCTMEGTQTGGAAQ